MVAARVARRCRAASRTGPPPRNAPLRTRGRQANYAPMPNAALAACLVLLQQPAVSRPPLTTRWTAEVTPEQVLPEYPRPDLVRPTWQTLNGTWQYAVRDSGSTSSPRAWDGTILVPFPIESQLSGVRRTVTDRQRLWYRRTFRIPSTAAGPGRPPP